MGRGRPRGHSLKLLTPLRALCECGEELYLEDADTAGERDDLLTVGEALDVMLDSHRSHLDGVLRARRKQRRHYIR